jgi:nucleotide-binding universal stress UspA family protein
MPFNRVLCAVDFSPDSLEAFRVAVEITRLCDASLHLFHVMEPPPALTGEALMQLVQKANQAMDALVASVQEGLDGFALSREVTSGQAFVEIVKRARGWRADLIVLGSKGTTSLEGLIMGGTAEGAVKEASCSVLVVRPGS